MYTFDVLRGEDMDYEKLYHIMFNAATDAFELLEAQNYGLAKERLRQAQELCEELYMENAEETDG